IVAVEVERMLRLAEQCLERAKSFIGKSADPPDLSASVSASSSWRKATSPTKTGHRRVMSEGGGELSPFLPPEIFQRIQTVESQDTSKKELTPIEEASRLNQKLKANYEARLARLTPGQAYQKTSLTLSLQRQMMENLIIAKARQDALQRKMEERRLRLQEEANRRFAASGAMTAEEQEQRILYTNVLEYEQDHDWPKLWKANMRKNLDDMTLVSGLVSYLKPTRTVGSSVGGQSFSADSSPSLSHDLHANYDDEDGDEPHTQVTVDRENSFEDLEQFLTQLDWAPPHGSADDTGSDLDTTCDPLMQPEQEEGNIQELEIRALTEHLKAVVKDIHIAIGEHEDRGHLWVCLYISDQLLSLCLLSFECLNTANSKDLCLASIEEAFFTPLWSALVALFRKVHREREQAFETSMKLYGDISPGDVGVSLKLFPQDPGALQGSYPYESAVQELRLLIIDRCPQRKLECIVRTLRLICACAEDYRCLHEVDSTPKTAAIGADDLLPILSFVALRSQCPQLVSECAALEEFIHEGYLIGEEGYCLTSMQSALAYVESLHTGGAHLPADKLT
uniref:VPS9 domain containing 1 n=1 Tax=Dicentrarchus labrax TaxID=13489 RepID=A0A8C4HE15_DICLA